MSYRKEEKISRIQGIDELPKNFDELLYSNIERVLRIYIDILRAYRNNGITIEQLQDMYMLDFRIYQKAQLAKMKAELSNNPESQLQIDTDYQTVIKSEDDVKSLNLAFKMLKDEFGYTENTTLD